MKLNPKFYERATIGSVWTILALIFLNGRFYGGVDIDQWIVSVYALFLVIGMLKWRE